MRRFRCPFGRGVEQSFEEYAQVDIGRDARDDLKEDTKTFNKYLSQVRKDCQQAKYAKDMMKFICSKIENDKFTDTVYK